MRKSCSSGRSRRSQRWGRGEGGEGGKGREGREGRGIAGVSWGQRPAAVIKESSADRLDRILGEGEGRDGGDAGGTET